VATPSWPDFQKYLEERQNSNPAQEESEDDRIKRLHAMFPPEKLAKIKKKELRRFIEKQDIKWSRWLESMSK